MDTHKTEFFKTLAFGVLLRVALVVAVAVVVPTPLGLPEALLISDKTSVSTSAPAIDVPQPEKVTPPHERFP